MEVSGGVGRGRGRGLVIGECENIGELRRPHVTPPEVVTAAQQHLHHQQLQQLQQQQQPQHQLQQQLQQLSMHQQQQQQLQHVPQQLQQIQQTLPLHQIQQQLQQQQQLQHQYDLQQQQQHQQQLQKQQKLQQQLQLQQLQLRQQQLQQHLQEQQQQLHHKQGVLLQQQMQQPTITAVNHQILNAEPKRAVKLSADAPEFVPRTFGPPQMGSSPQPQMGNKVFPAPRVQYLSHPVIINVNNLVVQLTMKPNKFDIIANQLASVLSWQVKDCDLMKEVIAVIFEQGVGEANFQYTGARLCQHLVKHIVQQYNGSTVKALLLLRCQEEFEVREEYMEQEPKRVCGFAMFLAEIYTQLMTSSSQPIERLGEAICSILITLMSQPTDSNLKCVAQVLKFTGSKLELTMTHRMEEVMFRLKDVALVASIGANTRALLLSVVELRAANWGHGPSSPTPSTGSSAETSQNVNNAPLGTVYYGPGGVIQHVEEDLEDSASDNDDLITGWSPAVEELEGEVADAFEEFLRLQ